MNTINVEELKPNIFFSDDLVIDKNFLLITNTIPLSASMIKALQDWDFKQVYSDGVIRTNVASSTISEKDFVTVSDGSVVGLDEQNSAVAKVNESIKKALEDAAETANDVADMDAKRLSIVQTVYNEYINYINTVYTRYATNKELNYDDLASTVRELCKFIKENKRFVLRIQPKMEAYSRDFLVTHSMRSTVLAISIGMQLRLPLASLTELGVACILHEIGMIRLPPQLYMTDRVLTPSEKKMIYTHPVLSYTILKEYDFPLKVCLGVVEHHERENGSGYPQRLSGEKISTYGKIIAVVCTFEAISAPRHYKDAQSSYEAMVEMLKNSRLTFDENIIKALLYSLSLFPIGNYVYLSDGRIGQVVDVNPENPKNPIVQIVSFTKTNAEPELVSTNDTTVHIIRALNKDETNDIKKVQNSQNK